MRRADRLFQIIQILRRRRRLTTAQNLADELEVSVRTVYRDVADLVSCGVPIDGEAGLGYLLRDGYHLPPLMFNQDEIDALVLGAQIVQGWSDPKLARAASDVLAKVEAALPEHLRRLVRDSPICAPPYHYQAPIIVDMAALRLAVRDRNKVRIEYADEKGAETARVLRPLALCFYGPIWLMVAWCELRQDFRSFRLDRIQRLDILSARFAEERGRTLRDYFERMEHAEPVSGLSH